MHAKLWTQAGQPNKMQLLSTQDGKPDATVEWFMTDGPVYLWVKDMQQPTQLRRIGAISSLGDAMHVAEEILSGRAEWKHDTATVPR